MRGQGTSLAPVHAGVRRDLELLLKMFQKRDSIRYSAFKEAFKELDFGLIFAGRQSEAELVEFEEKLLQMAASYCFRSRLNKDKDAYHDQADGSNPPAASKKSSKTDKNMIPREFFTTAERIFGIYITYTLFYLQPNQYVCQVRISPSQMEDLVDFLRNRLIPEHHADVVACLYKLHRDNAFRIVGFENVYDPSLHKRYDLTDDCDDSVPEDCDPPFNYLTETIDDISVQQLDYLYKEYESIKKEYNLEGVTVGALDVVAKMKSELANVRLSLIEPEKPAKAAQPLVIRSSKAEIKQEAYESTVKGRRQRKSAPDQRGREKTVFGKTKSKDDENESDYEGMAKKRRKKSVEKVPRKRRTRSEDPGHTSDVGEADADSQRSKSALRRGRSRSMASPGEKTPKLTNDDKKPDSVNQKKEEDSEKTNNEKSSDVDPKKDAPDAEPVTIDEDDDEQAAPLMIAVEEETVKRKRGRPRLEKKEGEKKRGRKSGSKEQKVEKKETKGEASGAHEGANEEQPALVIPTDEGKEKKAPAKRRASATPTVSNTKEVNKDKKSSDSTEKKRRRSKKDDKAKEQETKAEAETAKEGEAEKADGEEGAKEDEGENTKTP